ncbi:hypothetical protein HG531_014053 [Fusarium graminearum]|nr:hypothetical protein HG531_014053 [Fusarium graminearum]
MPATPSSLLVLSWPNSFYLEASELSVDVLGAKLKQGVDVLHGITKRISSLGQLEPERIIVLFLHLALLTGLVRILLGLLLGCLLLKSLLFLSRLFGSLLFGQRILSIFAISPVDTICGRLISKLEIDLNRIQSSTGKEGVVTNVIFPSHHVNVSANLSLAQREAVEVKLILLPHLKDGEDLLEPLESQCNIALARRATYGLCASEKSNRLESLFVLIVAKLIFGRLCVDVSVLEVELPGSVHCLRGFLQITAVLNDSGFGHGVIHALGVFLDCLVNVLHSFRQVTTKIVIVVLCKIVKRRRLSLVFALGIRVLGVQIVLSQFTKGVLLERIGVKVFEIGKSGWDSLVKHQGQIGLGSLFKVVT